MNRINYLSLTKDCVAHCILYIALFSTLSTNTSAQIIADHNVVDQYQDIPDQYIAEVKKMLITFAGESHSGAYRDGLILLMAQNAKFAAEVSESGTLPTYATTKLRCSRQIYTGSGWAETTGESRWYANTGSRNDIKNHIQYCKTNNLNLAVVGFGWCWDMSWLNTPGGTIDPDYNVHWGGSSEGGPQGNQIWGLNAADQALTGNSVCMDTYLNATIEYLNYCITNNINTKVVFTTGPIDDDGFNKEESGYQRAIKNDYIRNYVRNSPNNLILFDFADILAYNNAGQRQTTTWNSNTYEFIHNDNLLMLDGSPMNTGYHFGERGALRIGKALWWLLARIAGWDGNSTPDTQAPSAPTNLTSSNLSATSVRLSWTPSTDNVGVAGYVVYRGSDSITTVTATSYTVTGLSALTSYTFTVKAKDAAKNKSTASNTVTITTTAATDITKPSVPQNLTTSELTHNSVKLSWSASTDNVGVTGYTVFRGTDSLTTVTTLSYTATGLSSATAYSFTVRARDAAKNRSDASSTANITTLAAPDVTKPSAPQNLTASDLTHNSVKLSWSASTDNVGVTGYTVFRGTDSLTTVATLNYTVSGLSAATAYSFTVRARDAAKNRSDASSPANITTLAAPDLTKPSAPQNLTASDLTHNSVKLSWSASTDNVGVTGYTVFRGTDSLTTVTTLSHTVTGLSAATAYSFTVRARDAAKNRSNASTSVNITTLPATALNEIGEDLQSSLIKDLPYTDNNQLIINLTEPSKSAIKIEIFSISGINVYSQIIKAADTNISIEIPEIKPGVYILKVSNKTQVYKGKLLKL
jgi:chitodextrinase